MCDSENVDSSFGDGHVALCVSYGNVETSAGSRRSSPRHAAGAVLKLLLPALKVGVTMRLAHDRELSAELSLGRFGLTKREAEIARMLARRATNREIAEQLDLSRIRCGIMSRTFSRSSVFLRPGLSSRGSSSAAVGVELGHFVLGIAAEARRGHRRLTRRGPPLRRSRDRRADHAALFSASVTELAHCRRAPATSRPPNSAERSDEARYRG